MIGVLLFVFFVMDFFLEPPDSTVESTQNLGHISNSDLDLQKPRTAISEKLVVCKGTDKFIGLEGVADFSEFVWCDE